MQVSEIKSQLKRGDQTRIAKLAGSTAGTVKAILNGWRPSDTPTARRIIMVAQQIIENRKSEDSRIAKEVAR